MDDKPNVKNILVDLDGTLLGAYDTVVSIRFIRKTFWRLRRFGGWLAALKAMSAISKAAKMPQKFVTAAAGEMVRITNAEKVVQAVSGTMKMPREQAEAILNETVGAVFPSLQRFFYPMPGALEFLEWARTRYPIVLATNPVWPQEIIEMRAKWAGIDTTIFRSITHAGRMYACKPDREYYEEILAQEGFRHDECILIGNDLKNDLPAVRVGIPVFIVTKKPGLKRIPTAAGNAIAWSGTFTDLKKLIG